MADRGALYLREVEDFATWAVGLGCTRMLVTNPYELLRLELPESAFNEGRTRMNPQESNKRTVEAAERIADAAERIADALDRLLDRLLNESPGLEVRVRITNEAADAIPVDTGS